VEHTPAEIVAYVFVGLAVIVVVARLVGRLAVRLGQPAVVGEIIAGIALGPSLLGALPGDLDQLLFPTDVRPYLNVLAQLGLVLFMFIVGLEVDLSFIRGRERVAFTVSAASILLPFGLGIGLAFVLHPRHDVVGGDAVGFVAFALFLGVAMSITAFPVLARILSERGMHRTPTGVLALACAAVDDVFAWALLAVVVAVTVGGTFTGVAQILLLTVGFALVVFLVLRPLLRRLVERYEHHGRLTPDMLALVLVGVLGSAFITEEIGIHFIFGAFLFGVAMPRTGAAALNREVLDRIEQVSVLLLLPVFFVVTGLGVDIGGLSARNLVELLLVLLVAVAGKWIGASVAARSQGVPRRQATSLGVLMNTRGLTELVILNIGVGLGVLDGTMFTLLVVMAVVTTVMTAPLLRITYPPRAVQRDIEAAERAALGLPDAFTVLVVVGDPEADAQLVQLAADLAGLERPAHLVLSRVLPARPGLEVASGLGQELGLIAASGDQLRRLGRPAEARGLTTSVSARFSDDPWQVVRDQARSTAADVVLVRAGWGPAGAAPTEADELAASVVQVHGTGTEDDDVWLHVGGSPAARAAVRLAAQLAAARDAPLRLVGAGGGRARRQADGGVELLERAGLTVHREPTAAPTGLHPGPVGAAEPVEDGVVLAVLAGTDDRDRDLSETVADLETP
ncbi:K+/H+ exchanger, partial [Klenkia terrae]